MVDTAPGKLGSFAPFVKEQRLWDSQNTGNLVVYDGHVRVHGLIQAADMAFRLHYPLSLAPDDFLLPLIQSFAVARPQLEPGKEKLELIVERRATQDWSEVLNSFRAQIAQHVGTERCDLLSGSFTTTGPLQRFAYTVALMDIYQDCFSYRTMTMCGIPSITLRGTQQDWIDLLTKVRALLAIHPCKYADWHTKLLDTLTAIAETGGSAQLWNSFYKFKSGSGGDSITGWINLLFPTCKTGDALIYLDALKNPRVSESRLNCRHLDSFPSSISRAPATHTDVAAGLEFDTAFYAGQIGVSQDEKGTLSPAWGWALGISAK